MLSVMHRTLIASLLLAACGSSFMAEDAPAPDGGPADLALPGLDGGRSDAFVARPTSCTVELGEQQGEGCFCNGPIAYANGFLYRQSIGIEVYAADGGELTPMGVVEERGSAQGGLVIAAGHLVSLLDFAEDGDNLRVYSLDDPANPTVVGGLRLPHISPQALGANGDQVVVATSSIDEISLTWIDLSEPTEPTERWTRTVEATPSGIAVTERGAFLTDERVGPTERTQWLSWWDTEGSLVDEVELDGRRWNRTLLARGDELFVSGTGERTIERFVVGEGLTRMDALASEDSTVGGEMLIRGDLLLLSNPILIADVRSPIRQLGVVRPPIGDTHHLAAPDGPLEWVYGSGGNGVVAARITCE